MRLPTKNVFNARPFSADYHRLLAGRKELPVYKQLDRLLKAVQDHRVVILEGETGSGKTTQLAQAMIIEGLIKAGEKVAMTQNKVLQADQVGERIAKEMDVPLGTGVGVKRKGADSTSDHTRLDVLTDGSLVAEAKRDPLLHKYKWIIIDEAHQASTHTDLLLGILKNALKHRPDLKVIIMSATMDAAKFSRHFDGAHREKVEGREHEVRGHHLRQEPEDSTLVEAILQVHATGEDGNILVFVPGVGEMGKIIAGVQRALVGARARYSSTEVGPMEYYKLHATVGEEATRRAIEELPPAPRNDILGRKLILATNIAETSITLKGVTHVIDTCLVKNKIYNPEDESWWLHKERISKSVAAQRAGRAGRTRPGHCWRMCTASYFEHEMLDHAVPEILHSDMLVETITILALGQTVVDFPFINEPAEETIEKAFGILGELAIVNQDGRALTDRGVIVARMEVNPYAATMLLESSTHDCSEEMVSIASMMEAGEAHGIFPRASTKQEQQEQDRIWNSFSHPSGDHITYLRLYMKWREARRNNAQDQFVADNKLRKKTLVDADATRKQLIRILDRDDVRWQSKSLDPDDPKYYSKIVRALAAGSGMKVAKRNPSRPMQYDIVRTGVSASLLPGMSCGAPTRNNEWIIFREYVSGENKSQLKDVTAVPLEYLIDGNPAYWFDVESRPVGHIQERIVETLMSLTGRSEGSIRGGMPYFQQ
ncbi:putative pre-mRNA-splicing factor ATP-dependent RNA helicase dhx16 [Elasticomyces elasticus]|nr:putative pre-mRNA-splicing factor ATP-dependent RNA helicase dhx16 [Elasticomyces elasticus]KAK3668813.1 putative pre-mRNA-splicing factor ATP-dependent RNA helicase dhx16 [Elasticomyces elasticus]KAK4924930.1 putative pre-mRNA-splicing factor ATP-dependent RNA helicase dhx16 [Elasticomyces elasticus]KAK5763186.1 putative pre-mRNA-splicing factor ATP-dependent RNA helicase dhx16 [Elasticomyces elasticus]